MLLVGGGAGRWIVANVRGVGVGVKCGGSVAPSLPDPSVGNWLGPFESCILSERYPSPSYVVFHSGMRRER